VNSVPRSPILILVNNVLNKKYHYIDNNVIKNVNPIPDSTNRLLYENINPKPMIKYINYQLMQINKTVK
jgi:hypothetical protein